MKVFFDCGDESLCNADFITNKKTTSEMKKQYYLFIFAFQWIRKEPFRFEKKTYFFCKQYDTFKN